MIAYLLQKGFFRNANHAIWFAYSIVFLLFFILYAKGVLGKWVFLIPIVFHASPIFHGLRMVTSSTKNDIYSADCIWFNALIVGTYGFLMYIL